MAEGLRLQLAAPLGPPVADPDAGSGRDGGGGPCTYADLFAHAAPPTDVLRRVKDWAKPQMARHDAELPREVAGVIYFAAIVADRVRGTGTISELTDDRVRQGAKWALRLPWLDPGLADLFREAVAALESLSVPPPPPLTEV